MPRRALLLALLLLGPALGACSVESPFSVLGKPKLTGLHCAPPDACEPEPLPHDSLP